MKHAATMHMDHRRGIRCRLLLWPSSRKGPQMELWGALSSARSASLGVNKNRPHLFTPLRSLDGLPGASPGFHCTVARRYRTVQATLFCLLLGVFFLCAAGCAVAVAAAAIDVSALIISAGGNTHWG